MNAYPTTSDSGPFRSLVVTAERNPADNMEGSASALPKSLSRHGWFQADSFLCMAGSVAPIELGCQIGCLLVRKAAGNLEAATEDRLPHERRDQELAADNDAKALA
jgi:hypothetical protein